MSRKKRSKNKNKCCGSQDLSGIIDVQSEDQMVINGKGVIGNVTVPAKCKEAASQCSSPGQKPSKDVYFAFLPDKYEPLIDEVEDDEEVKEAEQRIRENTLEKKRKKKLKYKKYRKNVGKALRFGWRCMVAGLQSFAGAYASPLSAVATLVTDTQRASSKT